MKLKCFVYINSYELVYVNNVPYIFLADLAMIYMKVNNF